MRTIVRALAWAPLAVAVALVSLSGRSSADPLVKMEGGEPKPGVVTAWSGSGRKIELTVADGTDAAEVASTIEANLDRVKAKVKAGKVLVLGKTQDELLQALSEIDFGEGDDLGALAAATMDEGFDSGSSLRAKKTAELKKLLKDRKTTAMGKVAAVKTGEFPKAMVMVRIFRGPTGALGKEIRKGKTIAFIPNLKMKGGQVDLSDTKTQANIGAYYLEKGDRVVVKVGEEVKGGYRAEVITR